MLYWLYDIPTLLAVGLFAALFVGVCWIGIVLLSSRLVPMVHHQPGLNEILGDYLQYFGVIYGLLLGLLAVATYQNHSDVEKTVSNEASALAALYRDVSAYPEPIRSELEALLRDYARYVINEAWPLQRKGIIPAGAVKKVAAFFSHLASFEPETKSQVSLHRATLSEFNTFFEYRRSRLYSVTAGIPPVMWYTVAVGALINVFMIWLFNLRLGTHLLLGGLISFFTGTMICLIALLDHPFRGEVAVSPQVFELIYNQMMQE